MSVIPGLQDRHGVWYIRLISVTHGLLERRYSPPAARNIFDVSLWNQGRVMPNGPKTRSTQILRLPEETAKQKCGPTQRLPQGPK